MPPSAASRACRCAKAARCIMTYWPAQAPARCPCAQRPGNRYHRPAGIHDARGVETLPAWGTWWRSRSGRPILITWCARLSTRSSARNSPRSVAARRNIKVSTTLQSRPRGQLRTGGRLAGPKRMAEAHKTIGSSRSARLPADAAHDPARDPGRARVATRSAVPATCPDTPSTRGMIRKLHHAGRAWSAKRSKKDDRHEAQ